MSSKNRGLGRGFDALIPTQIVEEEFDPTAAKTSSGKRVSTDRVEALKLAEVDPNPHQPRQYFDEAALDELAASIRSHGVIQPIVVTLKDGRYELIAGERRLRAAKRAGLDTIPAIVRSYDDQQKLELALIENIQREDLNPIETATSYRKLIDQFNLTGEEVARRVGKDQSTVSNTMRLLNLPLEAKRAVASGKISEGHARAILALTNPQRQQELLNLILQNQWTVRQAEAFARDYKKADMTKQTAMGRVADTNDLTKSLGEYLGTKVTMTRTAKGGKLVIEFYSDEELERIYESIKHE